MMKGLQALVKTDRWKKNDGSDFVFFDPHPGFTDGTSDKEFKTLMCHTSKKSMHIVVERGQINICPVSPLCASLSDISQRNCMRVLQACASAGSHSIDLSSRQMTPRVGSSG